MRICFGSIPKCVAISSSTLLFARFPSAGSFTVTKKEPDSPFANDSFLAPADTRTLIYMFVICSPCFYSPKCSLLYHLHHYGISSTNVSKWNPRSHDHLIPLLCKLLLEHIRAHNFHNI